MANMSLVKNPMPEQDPNVRNKNFSEVALGYTAEQAVDEAKRCLNCKKRPCVGGCPVNVKIPDFIAKVAEGDFEGAYQVINQDSSLPAVCGRVCPQESQCEKYCVRGIKGEPVAIGRLERFVADYHRENCKEAPVKPEPNGHKVAIIGAGGVGYLVGFYPVDSALTAGLCMANRGGNGDLACLGAADRMELIAYAQLSSRLGGGIVLIIASFVFSFLLYFSRKYYQLFPF